MAIKTYIDAETGVAVQEISGALITSEIVVAQKKLYVEMGFEPANPCLWDATNGDVAGSMNSADMQRAVSDSEALWAQMAGGKTAILVGKDSDFGMARMS